MYNKTAITSTTFSLHFQDIQGIHGIHDIHDIQDIQDVQDVQDFEYMEKVVEIWYFLVERMCHMQMPNIN